MATEKLSPHDLELQVQCQLVQVAKRGILFQTKFSLEAQATKTIIEFPGWSLDSRHGNPFDGLPKCLVKQILEALISLTRSLQPGEWRLVELLLQAGHFTKIDLRPGAHENAMRMENLVVMHCPDLRELLVRSKSVGSPANPAILQLKQISVLQLENYAFDLIQLPSAASNWSKLKFLELMVQENDFEQLGSAQLEFFTNLKELHLGILRQKWWIRSENLAHKTVKVVLFLPSLEVLGCPFMDGKAFVKSFGQHAGHRNLLIDRLELKGNLDFSWPGSLSVRKLSLEASTYKSMSKETLATLCKIPADEIKELRLQSFEPSDCLEVLNSLAINVTKLKLSFESVAVGQSLDLHQMIRAAPKVVDLKFSLDPVNEQRIEHPRVQFEASYFRAWTNMDFYQIEEDEDFEDGTKTEALKNLYKLYLLGTEKLEVLQISMLTIKVALATLLANPGACNRVRKLYVFGYPDSKEYYAEEPMVLLALDVNKLHFMEISQSVPGTI